MRKHTIFLFTSDRNEGWGAVLNEAMSNGCAVVASNEIGSVPYLIKDKVNGMIFKSCNLNDLMEKVEILLNNKEECELIRSNAVNTMQRVWSPRNAAKAFFNLASYALTDRISEYTINDGPASWA